MRNKFTFDFFATDKNKQLCNIKDIAIDNLIPYHNHPFKLYDDIRFTDMVESIKNNGLFAPIIVRTIDKDTYEILSGHNRVKASKCAGLTIVPCVIKENITDDEAEFIVVESNLVQRYFADLTHSERAIVLVNHYKTLKSQGKRNDLINEIQNLFSTPEKALNNQENKTTGQVGNKLDSRDILGDKYGLSSRTIARYLRISQLIHVFQTLLDKREIGLTTGVTLSFLKPNEQVLLFNIVNDCEFRIDLKKAQILKDLSLIGKFTEEEVYKVFQGKKTRVRKSKPRLIKFKRNKLKKYFDAEQSVRFLF